MEPKKLKKFGLVGVFEDYQRRAHGPTFITTPGMEYNSTKSSLVNSLNDFLKVSFVHDSFYVHPAATTFGANQLETALAYLYTSLAHTLERMSRGYNVLVFQSIIDMYAEIVLNHRRQKWLEPLIQREVASYDMLVYIALKDQKDTHKLPLAAEKYDMMVRKLTLHFKGNYVQVESVQEASELIRGKANVT